MAFKQKGFPMYRNFGIGSSPAKQTSPMKDTKIPGGLDPMSDEQHKKVVPHDENNEHKPWEGGSPTPMKSPLEQEYVANVPETSGTVRMDETNYQKGKGQTIIPYSKEAEAAHLANIKRLSNMDLSLDEYNAEVAKTRHLPNPNPVVDEETTVYPENPKVEKIKKRRKGINIDFRKTKPRKGGDTRGGRIGYKLIPTISRTGTGVTFN